MNTVLLIYVVCGVIVYICLANKIQEECKIYFNGLPLHLANVVMTILTIVFWPYPALQIFIKTIERINQ